MVCSRTFTRRALRNRSCSPPTAAPWPYGRLPDSPKRLRKRVWTAHSSISSRPSRPLRSARRSFVRNRKPPTATFAAPGFSLATLPCSCTSLRLRPSGPVPIRFGRILGQTGAQELLNPSVSTSFCSALLPTGFVRKEALGGTIGLENLAERPGARLALSRSASCLPTLGRRHRLPFVL